MYLNNNCGKQQQQQHTVTYLSRAVRAPSSNSPFMKYMSGPAGAKHAAAILKM